MDFRTIREVVAFEKFFSKDQFEQLDKQENELGPEKILDIQKQWADLINQVRAEMDKKTPPEAPSVQKLTKEWIELRDLFTGGDPKTIKSVQKMYKENPNVGLQHGVDQAMLAYIQASADSMK